MFLVPNWLSLKMAGLVWMLLSCGRAIGCLGSIAGTAFTEPSTLVESGEPSTLRSTGFAWSGTVPTLLPKPSSPFADFSNPLSGFCICLATSLVFAGCFTTGATGTASMGLLSWPLTTWFDSMSFFPSSLGVSLCWSAWGFSCASWEFFELKLFVLSGILSGAFGFASTYRVAGGGVTGTFANASGEISMLNCRGDACFFADREITSVLSRYGATAKRNRWTKITAMRPIRTERDSGSAQRRAAARLIEASGVGAERAWVMVQWSRACREALDLSL